MVNEVRSLFIASEVRSGSTWAAECIAYFLQAHSSIQAFGLTHESFRDLSSASTVDDVIYTFDHLWRDANGLATAKLQCASVSVVFAVAQHSAEVRERFFGPRTRWIVLRREDRIGQAISLAAARKTHIYHTYDESLERQAVDLSTNEKLAALRAVLYSDLFLEEFAARLDPTRAIMCFYADIRRDTRAFLRSVYDLCAWEFPEGATQFDLSKLKRMASDSKSAHTIGFGNWLLSNFQRERTTGSTVDAGVPEELPDPQAEGSRNGGAGLGVSHDDSFEAEAHVGPEGLAKNRYQRLRRCYFARPKNFSHTGSAARLRGKRMRIAGFQ